MELIPGFNPTSAASGQFTASTLQPGSTVIINNKSYVNMIFTFASGDQRLVLANDRRALKFAGASAGPGPVVKWEQESIDYPQTINQLENIVYVEIYAPSEIVAETYPANIQRETLPKLVPYNVGYTSKTFAITSGAPGSITNVNPVIWPSSYLGIAIAPSNSPVGGFGFDYFWSYQRQPPATGMASIPSSYPSTGKAINTANAVNIANMSYVAGPFSLPGLTAIDTGTHLTGTAHWTTAVILPWNTASGFWVEMWFRIDQVTSGFHQLFGDGNLAGNTGVDIFTTPTGQIGATVGFTGGAQNLRSSANMIANDTWYQVVLNYDTTFSTPNTLFLYLNGNLVASTQPAGTAVNAASPPWLGGNIAQNAFMAGGSIDYIGLKFGNFLGPFVSNLTPQARYEHGIQSLNVDYQNAWISRVAITTLGITAATATSAFSIFLNNTYNTAGLLSVSTAFSQDNLHTLNQYQTQIQWFLPSLPAQGNIYVVQDHFTDPLGQQNDIFPSFSATYLFGPNDPAVIYEVQGYNILGIV